MGMPEHGQAAGATLLPEGGRWRLAMIGLLGLVQAGLVYALLRAAALLVGDALAGAGPDPFAAATAALGALGLGWFGYRERVDSAELGIAVIEHLRQRIDDRAWLAPADGTGVDAAAGEADLTALGAWYSEGLIALLVGVPVLLGGLAALAAANPVLAEAMAAIVCVALIAHMLIAPGLIGAEAAHAGAPGAMGAAPGTVRASGVRAGRNGAHARVRAIRRRSLSVAVRHALIALTPLTLLGVWMLTGPDGGSVAAALMFAALVLPRVAGLGRVFELRRRSRAARRRLAPAPTSPRAEPDPTGKTAPRSGPAAAPAGGVQLDLVDLAITGIVSGVSARVEPGTRIALIGAKGAGKRQLLGVIAGRRPPSAGSIRLNGQTITPARRTALLQAVTLVQPDTPLMPGTVDSNIRYGARVAPEEAEAILERYGYRALIEALPEGGETETGPGSPALTADQRNRILLLRALLRGASILLLDRIDEAMEEPGRALLARVFETFEGSVILATSQSDWRRYCTDYWHLTGRSVAVGSTRNAAPTPTGIGKRRAGGAGPR